MNSNNTAATAAPLSETREPRLADHLRRLNEISRTMGAGQLDIEDAFAMYEEGAEIHRRAKGILAQVRLRIARLDGESKGEGDDAAVGIGLVAPRDMLSVEEDDLPF